MKNIKKLLLVVVVLLGIFTLTGCNNYKYPNEIPTISNPENVYATIGDYKVSNAQVYYRALASYGVDTLNTLIDDALLPKFDALTAEEKADFEEYRNNRIYGTNDLDSLDKEEKEEAYEDFLNAKIAQGLFTEQEAEDALKLEYRRYVFAANEVKKEIAAFEPVTDDDGEVIQENYFTETEIKNATATAYPNETTVILLTFRSELEAKSLMKEAGIYTDTIDYRGWQKLNADGTAGAYLSQTEVYDAFIEMYNTLYGHLGCSIKENAYKQEGDKFVWNLEENANGYNNFDYNYTELSKISSTIAKKVFETLTVKNFASSYTTAPNKYLTKYFLALEVAENNYEDIEASDAKLEKQLIENKLTAALVDYYLYKNRVDSELVIYDRGLEIPYKEDFDTVYESANKEERYEKTELTSKTNVATFKANGAQVAITADKMFEALSSRYGVTVAIGYISQYIVLADKYNDVFDFVTGEILDKKAYDELYEEEIAPYKEELKANTFATVGYPKGYGWENFLRDRFGVLNEIELIALGALYDESLEKLGEASYSYSNDASIAISNLFTKLLKKEISRESYLEQIAAYTEAAEDTLQYQMQKIVDDFFNVKATTLRVFVDLNHDGAADDLTAEVEANAKMLIDYVLLKANDETVDGATYSERVATIVKEYNLSSINDTTKVGTSTYAKLKELGIEITVSAETAYKSASITDEDLAKVIKAMWNDVKDGKVEGKVFDSNNKTLEFNNELISDFYVNETAVLKAIVTEASDFTYVSNTASKKEVLPTEELIDRYNTVNKPADEKTDEELKLSVSTREKAALEAYYTVALNEFMGDSALGDTLIELRGELFDNGTIKFTNAKDLEKYEIFMNSLD